MAQKRDNVLNVARRDVLRTAILGGAVSGLSLGIDPVSARSSGMAVPIERGKTRPWIGPEFWSNRFQDWRLHDGRIECLNGDEGFELRTLGLLTHDVNADGSAARISGRFKPLTSADEDGLAGFLIGVGGGQLDYRAAALAQRGSGENGGFMAVVDCHGRVAFRDHTDEDFATLSYDELDGVEGNEAPPQFVSEGVDLVLEIKREGDTYEVALTAFDVGSGEPTSFAQRSGVTNDELIGSISLLSSPPIGKSGARWAIESLQLGGDKLSQHPARSLGPVIASLYSLSDQVLKMTAQFMPLGDQDPSRAQLEIRRSGGDWQTTATAAITDGYVALFRVEGWDDSRDWEYRISFEGSSNVLWSGTVRKDPKDTKDLDIALYSCISSTAQSMEGGRRAYLPQEKPMGRFSPRNFYFPHNDLATNTLARDPDLLLVCGDQYYEHNPIRFAGDTPHRKIDTLYRWYLWLWSFREIIKDRPSVFLIDDHDVLHGNIWGQGGIDSPDGDQNQGGYMHGADLVRMVHACQTGHNPDPYDPTPVKNDIPVAYGEFFYGGVSFAVIEDRKWKTAPQQGRFYTHVAELLGARQEKFLAEWKNMRPGAPKVVVSQSIWSCLQTSPEGRSITDFDSNGYPPLGRRKAVSLVKDAGAVMIAGDQHLASVVRQGIDSYDDGPIQFSGPAGAAYWQRWFDPLEPLPNARDGVAESGDWIDGFGNKMNIMAVANPKITFAEMRAHRTGPGQALLDPDLKSEGYGVLRVSHQREEFEFECWPTKMDPTAPDARQYAGWPLTVRFDET